MDLLIDVNYISLHFPAGSTTSTTRRGKLLKHQIPVRTFFDWNDLAPGFVEADLAAHCGDKSEGSYLSMLTVTDIATMDGMSGIGLPDAYSDFAYAGRVE